MLSMADTSFNQFLPLFANTGIPVAFLVPTPNGHGKSIMDATCPVRELLLNSQVHDYESQEKGPENKVRIPAHFVNYNNLTDSVAFLYRPVTKKGDPRIWFSNLRQYCQPFNLLALIVIKKNIYVFNLSKPEVATGLLYHGFAYSVLEEAANKEAVVANELLAKLKAIHRQGFFPSITSGDPGVGDTLEHALGIRRNNLAVPDYKGIELKTTRLTRGGKKRITTRVNLFAKVPENGMSYSQIVYEYGKWTYIADKHEDRLAIENTTFASHPNSYGLILDVDTNDDKLSICHVDENMKIRYLSYWLLTNLRKQLLIKHHETFWVQAQSIIKNGIEWFQYDKVIHTKNPNDSLFAPLLETDKIMVELLG